MTILIYGITGDLAKTKILPSLREFGKNDKNLKVIGYSRSLADKSKLTDLLGFEPILKTGSYGDLTLIKEFWQEELVVYLATPPSVNFDFLRQIAKQKPNPKLQILVEKPFGKNREEASEILELLNKTGWRNSVQFLDHYKFKINQLQVPTKINTISICALESNIVGERGGYYDVIGAIDDMLIHLYSMLKMVFPKPISTWQDICLETKQYDTYRQEVSNSNSKTETYFKINCTLGDTKVLLESGKKQATKLTKIDINNGEYVVELAPNKHIFSNGKVILLDNQKSDHCRIFEAIQKQGYSQFVSDNDILEYFDFLDQVNKI